MDRMIRFACPACGKRLKAEPRHAGRRARCHGCAARLRVGTLSRAVLRSLPFAAPAEPPARSGRVALWLCVPLVLAGSLLIGDLAWSLDADLRAEVEARANRAVAGHVRAAREYLARNDWDGAIRLLNQAVATENATDLDDARALLDRAERARAGARFAEVEAAVKANDLARAGTLLRDYLADPGARDRVRARRLLQEVELAGSDARALARLAELPEAAFQSFAGGGDLDDLAQIHTPSLRTAYAATLRRNLPRARALREERRRAREEAARRDRAQRLARLRATPVYRELREFVARTRGRDRDNRAAREDLEKELLEASLQAQGNPQAAGLARREQEQARRWRQEVEDQVSRLRANVKERIRTYPGFGPADWALFDSLADAELDGLWKEIGRGEDGEGL